MNICAYFKVYRPLHFFKYRSIKCRFRGPVARERQPWQPFSAPLVGDSSPCYTPSMNLIGPPSTELLQLVFLYVT